MAARLPLVTLPSKYDRYADFTPNLNQHIYLYTGKGDITRAPKEARSLIEQLKGKKYTNVRLDEKVEKMDHVSNPDLCIEWMNGILKQSAKARKARRKIAADVEKLKAKWAKGRPSYSPLKKLVEKEQKVGIQGAALALLFVGAKPYTTSRPMWDQDHRCLQGEAM